MKTVKTRLDILVSPHNMNEHWFEWVVIDDERGKDDIVACGFENSRRSARIVVGTRGYDHGVVMGSYYHDLIRALLLRDQIVNSFPFHFESVITHCVSRAFELLANVPASFFKTIIVGQISRPDLLR